MQRLTIYIGIISLFTVLSSCSKKTKLANTPKISFQIMDPSKMSEGSDSTLHIYLNLEDGDGDIGFGTNNLFMKDSRDTIYIPFMIPEVPDDYNPADGVKGVLQIDYDGQFLLKRTDSLHLETDTLFWSIYMKDAAGNVSNVVETSKLVLTN
ncbi:MAG: hypothetical protein JNJ58_11170 [Chitinophagaceae bacterium]|nr:hypothetical protein [Chitinophagaceae bacterium]